jgi:hypothetical protein
MKKGIIKLSTVIFYNNKTTKMKKYVPSLLFLVLSFCASAQIKKEIITADIVTINSKILKENRTVWVYNPGDKKQRNTYPVIYVLWQTDILHPSAHPHPSG